MEYKEEVKKEEDRSIIGLMQRSKSVNQIKKQWNVL